MDEVIRLMEEAGWSHDFIYLDNGNNRFVVQKQGEDFIKEVKDQNIAVKETVASLQTD